MVALAQSVVGHVVTAVIPQEVTLPHHAQQHRLVDAAVPLGVVDCRLAQLPDINIKAEILGRKYVSSRCDWGSLTTKPSLSSVTELRAS